jgi:hypothetical protein
VLEAESSGLRANSRAVAVTAGDKASATVVVNDARASVVVDDTRSLSPAMLQRCGLNLDPIHFRRASS